MAAVQAVLFEWTPDARPQCRLNAPEVAELHLADYWDWAAKVAREMHRGKLRRFDRDDLIQLARIGLWKAALRYDSTSPVRFAVFAKKWVKGEILMGARRGHSLNASMLSVCDLKREPIWTASNTLNGFEDDRLSEESRRLVAALRAGLTLEEIAATWGCMVADLERLANLAQMEIRHELANRV